MPTPKYLTLTGLAERWGLDPSTLHRMRRDGKPLPPGTKIGSRTRYAISDIEAFEREQKEAEAPDPAAVPP